MRLSFSEMWWVWGSHWLAIKRKSWAAFRLCEHRCSIYTGRASKCDKHFALVREILGCERTVLAFGICIRDAARRQLMSWVLPTWHRRQELRSTYRLELLSATRLHKKGNLGSTPGGQENSSDNKHKVLPETIQTPWAL